MARHAKHNDERERVTERPRVNERKRKDERRRIAHLAARIMAEDGIEDHGVAKKKAARQAGVSDTHQLPGNDEIDDALKLYRDIYHADDHRLQLTTLREIAACAMAELEAFNPHLTGTVLSGNAGKYAGIQLQLFTDDSKAVELFLIDHGIDYEAGQTSLYSGDTRITIPLFTLNDDGAEIEIAVLSARDARGPLKTSRTGKTIERAKLAAVEALLSQTAPCGKNNRETDSY